MQKENGCKISLLIPTYNSGTKLNKSLDSIRKQHFSSVEVILIDGGSSDITLKIAEENQDLITIVVSEPDKGIYDAINKGVGLASGKLICVLGSDDELCPDALKSIFEAWSSSPTDIVAGKTIMVSPDGAETVRVDEDYGVGALLSGIPFGHNAMFVTPETYKKVGAYNLNYNICADADWVHRAIRLGCTCEQIDTPIVRFGLEGLSSTNPDQIMEETYQIISQNFEGLSLDDAEGLFRAVRGWSDGADVDSILSRYKHIPDIFNAVDVAFSSRERRRMESILSSNVVSKPRESLMNVACRGFAKFKSVYYKTIIK